MNYDRPELRDRLAAEYVLGTLHGQARRRFQRLMRGDPKMRVAVEMWEQRLMPMGGALSGPAPTARLWRGIEQRIAPAGQHVPATAPGWFERWLGWRTLAPLAAGVVVGVAGMLAATQFDDTVRVAVPAGRVLPESYAGFLQNDKGATAILISSLRHGRTVDIKVLSPIPIRPDQALQLWALEKGAEPIALGVIPVQGKAQITIPDTSEKLLAKVTELAVSVEAKDAAPVAKPSQPFLLRGPCAKFW